MEKRNYMKNMELTQSLCEKIIPIIEPLSQQIKPNVFGYRKFFSDGTGFTISSNFELTKAVQEKFGDTAIPNYENEVRSALKNEKHIVLRIGEPDRQDVHLSALFDWDVWNTLSLYWKGADSVDAFYFTSTRKNYRSVEEYVNNISLLEQFSYYFKNKLNDIISPQEMKKESSLTISPKIFEEYRSKATQN